MKKINLFFKKCVQYIKDFFKPKVVEQKQPEAVEEIIEPITEVQEPPHPLAVMLAGAKDILDRIDEMDKLNSANEGPYSDESVRELQISAIKRNVFADVVRRIKGTTDMPTELHESFQEETIKNAKQLAGQREFLYNKAENEKLMANLEKQEELAKRMKFVNEERPSEFFKIDLSTIREDKDALKLLDEIKSEYQKEISSLDSRIISSVLLNSTETEPRPTIKLGKSELPEEVRKAMRNEK